MSHVELLEAQGNPWGLVLVIVALTLICTLTVAIAPWLRKQHDAGLARVRTDSGGPVRLADRFRWAKPRHDEGITTWQADE